MIFTIHPASEFSLIRFELVFYNYSHVMGMIASLHAVIPPLPIRTRERSRVPALVSTARGGVSTRVYSVYEKSI